MWGDIFRGLIFGMLLGASVYSLPQTLSKLDQILDTLNLILENQQKLDVIIHTLELMK